MKINLLPARALAPGLVARWDEILQQCPELASPYFRPEFVQAVAALRDNVELAVLRDADQIVGFWPFERVQGCVARPVGGRLSDYQAVIAATDVPWRADELLQACGLKAWQFDHQLASQAQLAPFTSHTGHSRTIDLSAGYDIYVQVRKAAGAGALGEMLRKSRKLQREHNVRFEWHSADEAAFDQLLAWKSEQYRRSDLTDLFQFAWIVRLLKNLWRMEVPGLAGVLSVLYVNDKVAAVHFGMRSGPLLHSWFPAYDMGLSKYSPGAALLLLMAEHAARHDVSTIDLGKGDEEYKLTFATGAVPLIEGEIETRRARAAVSRGWQQARTWVKQSPLHEPARMPIRWFRQMRDWMALR
jgi:CelD/BcsL family acetyltransferase involved in cellulose biosynthesis